jgi:PAS domain S-box-containing protein
VIVASLSDGVIGVRLDGTITDWNGGAEAIFGYRSEEVLGKSISLLAAPGREYEMPLILERIRNGERIENSEAIRQCSESLEIAISSTVSPICDADGRIVGASWTARDISERKRAEAALVQLNKTLEQRVSERTAQLEAANRRLRVEMAERADADARLRELQSEVFHAARLSTVGQMASGLAHELNQPLGAASNLINAARLVLATGKRPNVDTATEIMHEAAAEVLRAGEIIRRVRDFASLGETERQSESVVSLIEESSALALTGAGAASVQAFFRFDPRVTYAFANRIEIQQVLVNLIRNALDAMAQGSRRELEIRTSSLDQETVEIAIVDSGPGIPAELRDRVFEPFVSTKANGMGLGLSICRSIVEAHGGRLRAVPNPGGGTIFRFTLPSFPEECER